MARPDEDEQLMTRVREGDHRALEFLVRRYAAPLLSFLTRMQGDRTSAEDTFQEVWLAVWVKRRTFDSSRRFKPWLYRIASNRCASDHRRPSLAIARGIAPDELAGGFTSSSSVSDAENSEAVHAADKAIQGLPPTQRQVVSLRLYASASYAEIAAILQVSESTVRSNMSHALCKLRNDLAQWVEIPESKESSDDHARARGQHPRHD